jgi:hypothetical protein
MRPVAASGEVPVDVVRKILCPRLETRQVDEARKNPNFYVYVVENVRQGDRALFTLRVLGGARLQHLLIRAKEQHYYTVPCRSRTTTVVLQDSNN